MESSDPSFAPSGVARFVDALNRDYERIHTAKEDAFWVVHMGLAPDARRARAELEAREIELARFLRDPDRLSSVRREIERLESAIDLRGHAGRVGEEDLVCLAGWLATFEAHAIESRSACALAEEIVAAESELARARSALELRYEREPGCLVPATSVELGVLLSSDPDERVRRSAWEGLRAIEEHVLAHGFLDLVRRRNRLARELGADDYYDWKVRRVEGLTKAEVFELLDELERDTRESAERAMRELASARGRSALRPWNTRYWISGDLLREQDPYFPFSQALDRWGRSFAGLGVHYRGATLVLDLVDRPGKYENGFMHGPAVAWRERGRMRPARIHFSANAIPGLAGAGRRASETLFHEGGHAAHFANVDMPAPCFGQEFAPTSVAFAETQSMFFDALLSDADWQWRYARDLRGERMPVELIEREIRSVQPFAAWMLRAMLSVCYAERAIYEIPDDELDLERVLTEIRAIEKRLSFLDQGAPRPTLSVPHLLSGESSAYYHGYVLAEMAVEQTRDHFASRDGHVVDNPRVGPELAECYWRPGNSRSFHAFVEGLCGAPLGAAALARRASRTVERALEDARRALAREREIPVPRGAVDLGCRLSIVHGAEEIARAEPSEFESAARAFERWIDRCSRASSR